MQIGILEPKDFSKKALSALSNIGSVELFSGLELGNFLVNKKVLFIRLSYFVDKNFLDKAKSLKYICTPTTGLNHIDLNECKKNNIKIISLRGEYKFLSNIRATPEHTFGLVLSLLRNYKKSFLSKHNQAWDREKYKGFELYENCVGILGFGRVGKILSKYFEAFGSKVYFYDTDDSVEEINNSSKVKSIKNLINKSNIVILSTSYCVDNYQFFDKKYIDLLKNKYFINISRGELVDEKYLIKRIEGDYFKGLAIDVLQDEQSNKNYLIDLLRLAEDKNFIITPHIAGATYASMHKTEEFVVKKYLNMVHCV